MKDFTLEDVAKTLSLKLQEKGVRIPYKTLLKVIKHHFQLIDRVMASPSHDNIVMYSSDVTAIFKPYEKDNKEFDSTEFMKALASKRKLSRKVMTRAKTASMSMKTPEEMDLEPVVI